MAPIRKKSGYCKFHDASRLPSVAAVMFRAGSTVDVVEIADVVATTHITASNRTILYL